MRLRLVSVQVVPTFVIEDDDGNLSPAPELDAITVLASRIGDVSAIVLGGVADLEASLFGSTE
jgi:hypothetical protein